MLISFFVHQKDLQIEAAADGAEPDADFHLEFSEVLIVRVVVAVEPDGDFPLGFSEASIVLVAGDVFALVELMFAAALLGTVYPDNSRNAWRQCSTSSRHPVK